MKYMTPRAFRQALSERLSRIADARGSDLATLQRAVVMQQFLARLAGVVSEGWALTGGVALDWRLSRYSEFQRRTTVDLDVLYAKTEETVYDNLVRAAQVALNDRFRYAVERARVNPGANASYRFVLTAYIDTVLFMRVAIDVGVLDPLGWDPELLPAPVTLEELGIGGFTIPSLPLAHYIAEKVHAITRTIDGRARSRVAKDIADLVVLSKLERPVASKLREALEAVFSAYRTHPLPEAMPATPQERAADYAHAAKEYGIPADLADADRTVGDFLNPVLMGEAEGLWNPERHEWG